MAHALTKICIHAILGTKYRKNFIIPSIKEQVYELLDKEMKLLDCRLIEINGMPDHVHVLFLMNRNKSISEIMKRLKGASSYKINKEGYLSERFSWQVGYGAFSVSESTVHKVRTYIQNQEQHHQNISFEQEYKKIGILHGLDVTP